MLWSTLQAKFRAFELLETRTPDISIQQVQRAHEQIEQMASKRSLLTEEQSKQSPKKEAVAEVDA